jgi:predicted RNase H-like HicB family nuclease
MKIRLEIRKLDEGPYVGTSPDLPGLIVQGATPEEVAEIAPDVAEALIAVILETAQPLPPGLHPLERPARIQIVVPT